MDKYKIDHAVVLNLSQLYGNGLTLEEMKKALRFQNDFNAGIQEKHPNKFTSGFVVHPGYVDGALWEIERCVVEKGMRLLCLPTHYMNTIQGFDGRPDLFEGKHHPRRAVGHKNIFFDTLVHDTGSLKLLLDNASSKQVVMGLDDPYPLGEMESESQSSYPGKILDLAVERQLVTPQEVDSIWSDNILQWLCGDDEQMKNAMINRILG
jgi:hypothetical protein